MKTHNKFIIAWALFGAFAAGSQFVEGDYLDRPPMVFVLAALIAAGCFIAACLTYDNGSD